MSTDEDKSRTIYAVINLLRKVGIKAGLSVHYESGHKTLVIVLPGIDVKQFVENENDK